MSGPEDGSEAATRKVRAAYLSVASNTLLVVGKLAVGLAIASVAVVSEAVHSGIDLLAALLATFAVRASIRPADSRHAYGHGKFEDLSGTIEALLIFIAALIIIYESIRRITHMEEVGMPVYGLVVMGISAGVNMAVSHHLFKVAQATDSVALEADALHLRTDVWTSLGVMAAMAVIWLTGWDWVDPVVAIGVAVLIAWAAFQLTRRTFSDLVDAALPEEEQEAIRLVLIEHVGMHMGWDSLRTRRAGPVRYIDLHLHFPPSMSVAEAHEIAHHIQDEIEDRLPRSDVHIHLEPCQGDCRECLADECEDRSGGEGA